MEALPNLAALPEGNGTARGKATNVASMFRSISLADELRRADAKAYDRATKGCFNGTSTRVLSDKVSHEKRSPYETLKKDDHLGPNNEL